MSPRLAERAPARRRPAPARLHRPDGTPIEVVHLTAEYFPYARTGGLAEAVGGLARFQSWLGVPTTVVMPFYPSVSVHAGELMQVGEPVTVELGGRRETFRVLQQVEPPEHARLFFLAHPGFFERSGVYGEAGADYPDNAERWAFFCRAALEMLPRLGRRPPLLHMHDWHCALAAVYLRCHHRGEPWYDAVRTVLSVHNAGYQGHYGPAMLKPLGLPAALFEWRQLEWYGQLNVLKGGLVFADAAVTVSPNHARELCTEGGGFGLHAVFRSLGPRFLGILNGIDQQVWDPARDALIAAQYDGTDPTPKAVCKRAVQRHFGLAEDPQAPLFVMVARLVKQKGIDIILDGPELLGLAAQFVFLGSGDLHFEGALRALAARRRERMAVETRFGDALEHALMAAGDFLLMPCEYEPCGLTQMRAQRYGTLPVVRRVGGLADTVEDGVTGFVFDRFAAEPLLGAALRGLDAWSDPAARRGLQVEAMGRDFGWERSVEQYLALYHRVATGELAAAA
jgi:starch synthase